MDRKRLTWDRKASAHPATPDEGPASPAGKADPGVDDYKNGDTSSWAEDPSAGPYPNSAHPATPDEGPASPAYKAAALERKAARCIRIAQALLGKEATIAAVEDQALAFMDMPDSSITASLKRLGADEPEEEETEEESKKAGEEDESEEEESKKAGEEPEEEDEEESKKASDRFASIEHRIARIERILIRLAEEEGEGDESEEESKKAGEEDESEEEESKKAGEEPEEEDEEESKKAGEEDESEEEEAKKAACGDDDALLEAMLREEGMMDTPEESMDMEDPLSVMDADVMGEDEAIILAKLYEDTPKQAGEDSEEKEEEEEEPKKEASAPRPQPKKASTGATRLGGPVTKEATSEVNDLSKLWESAPDISQHFK